MLYSFSLFSILEVLLVIVPALLSVAYVTVAERKTMASMQRRVGPNKVGYLGLLQALKQSYKRRTWGFVYFFIFGILGLLPHIMDYGSAFILLSIPALTTTTNLNPYFFTGFIDAVPTRGRVVSIFIYKNMHSVKQVGGCKQLSLFVYIKKKRR
jgi:formate hydrogenlyase subunit 4